MRKLLQILLLKPVLWANEHFASRPQKDKIYAALSRLCSDITTNSNKKGLLISFNEKDRFIVFSDQHRGAKDGADDFMNCEPAFLSALDHYYRNGYSFINLGDCEELWENSLSAIKRNYTATFEAERLFVNDNRFYKIFGNHDLYWMNDPFAWWQLKSIYGREIQIYEGLVLRTLINEKPFDIFLTHGHQGDASSDGNWFSKFFVSRVWAPLQAYLKINPNTPAFDEQKKTAHNHIMYEWSSQHKDIVLITGHTHQPVFGSLTHLERLYKMILMAKASGDEEKIRMAEDEVRKREREYRSVTIDYLKLLPSYFNTGCCCYGDGDITGIEISDGKLLLIKWTQEGDREVLEEITLKDIECFLRTGSSRQLAVGIN